MARRLGGRGVVDPLLPRRVARLLLDFVVDLPIALIPDLARTLGPDFEVDQEALADAIRRRSSWNIYFLPSV
ncbi:MAG: hypothetical protein IRZ16_04990 [Myxococcaceae bacterium]|nr:hypothetical protein [Myxococcaceae bacterium]